MKLINSILMFIGRFCISIIFILQAIVKVTDYGETSELMASKGFVAIPLLLYGAALLELFGGLALLLGCKTRVMAVLLLLFLIPVTYLFHDFWIIEGADRQTQMILFAKNLAIFGGLIYIITSGPGGCSIDALMKKKKPPVE